MRNPTAAPDSVINAELHKAADTRHVVIPGNPPLSVLMDLYIDHAKP